ncbi:MAG: ABC transporter permease [Paludibacteraceae bacterium]|nr:ABC transporter permease [Prevotellaceae bacterium]
MKALKYLIKKELLQFKRNSFLPRLVVMFPLMLMLVFPWVASMEVDNLHLALVDNDHSSVSRRLKEHLENSSYFSSLITVPTYGDAIRSVETATSDIILTIPHGFEEGIVGGGEISFQIDANSVNGTKGSLGSSYLANIIDRFLSETVVEKGGGRATVHIIPHYLYNSTLNYRHFMVPALMIILILMLCGALPAMNIVSEKEKGTIEQLNVTPVSRAEFILAKLIPYWTIGMVVLSICFLIAWGVYDLAPAGGFLGLYLGAMLFILVMSGVGLIISNYSSNMLQAMLLMFFIILVCNLMSGIFTPISSMPRWAQLLTYIVFPHYFVEIMRGIYLQGNSIIELWSNYAVLMGFALFFNTWAVISYKKQG